MLLKINSKGPDVEHVQSILKLWSNDPNFKVDGEFGQKTEQKVKEFQAAHFDMFGEALKVDGQVGDKTMWALDHLADEDINQPEDAGVTSLALRALQVALDYFHHNVRENTGSNRGKPNPGDSEKYSVDYLEKQFGLLGEPWCAMFAWTCYHVAGLELQPNGFAAVYTFVSWARKNGYLHSSRGFIPQPGDLFCIGPCTNFSTSHHIGMVEKYNMNGTISTIEGNSNNRVAARTRAVSGGKGGENSGDGITYYIRIPGR